MAKLYWCRAEDGRYDALAEFRACRSRNSFEAALLLVRLKNARDFGPADVAGDEVIGMPLFFYHRGVEGVIYVVADDPPGAEVTALWVGRVSRDIRGPLAEAGRRLNDLAEENDDG